MRKNWLTVGETAERIEGSPSQVRRLVEEEELEGRRDGPTGPLLVSEESVEEFLDEEDDRDDEEHADDVFDRAYDEGFADGKAEAACDDEDDL